MDQVQSDVEVSDSSGTRNSGTSTKVDVGDTSSSSELSTDNNSSTKPEAGSSGPGSVSNSSSVLLAPFLRTDPDATSSTNSSRIARTRYPWRNQSSPSSHEGNLSKDGREYMVAYESFESSEERNTPLPPPPKSYDVGQAIRKQIHREKIMTQEIHASFYKPSSHGEDENETPLPFNRHFLVVHFGDYYTNYKGAHPAEFAIADFSIRDGISYCFSRMLDPGSIPLGFRSDFRESSEKKGYELPGFDPGMDFGVECLDIIENLIDKYITEDDPHGTVYTVRPDVDNVTQSLKYVAERAGRSFNFKVFPMSRLVELLFLEGEHLRSLNKIEPTSIVYSEENALALLVGGDYDAYEELGCNFHTVPSKLDTLEFCSLSLVKRWIYNCLAVLTKLYCCPMYMHTHVPKLDTTPFFIVEEPDSDSVRDSTPGKWSWTGNSPAGATGTPPTGGSLVTETQPPTEASTHGVGGPTSSRERSQPTPCDTGIGEKANPRERNQSPSHSGSWTGGIPSVSKSRQTISGSMTSGGEEIELRIHRVSNAAAAPPQVQAPPAQTIAPEEPERELTPEDFVTIQVFPQLCVDICLNPAERAMEVFRMPDMNQRQFPPMTYRIELLEFVPGRKSRTPHPAHPMPPTVITLEERDLLPVSDDFSFRPKKRPESSLASYDTYFSSVSKMPPLPESGVKADPLVMAQAYQLLEEGVVAQTKFAETGKYFWDTELQRTRQGEGGRGRPREPEPEHVSGGAQIPMPHLPEIGYPPLPPAEPAWDPLELLPPFQPRGRGRQQPGRGRGRARLPFPVEQQPPGLPPAGLEDFDDLDNLCGSITLSDETFWKI